MTSAPEPPPPETQEQQPAPSGMPVPEPAKLERVLVVSAHPDDPEFGFGGTVAKLASEGVEVRYVICTDGSQGGEDPEVPDAELTARRYEEQRAAATVLGVKDVVFLGFKDGHLEPNLELRLAITREIRRFKPDAVFTHSPLRNLGIGIGAAHPDHLAVGGAAFAAVYPDARNPRAFRELLAEGLEAHKVKEIWVGAWSDGDHFVDVTGFVDLKIESLRQHRSQVAKPGQEWEFEKFIRERMADAGKKAGVEAAEGFRRIPTG
jgi:LmbE family N-acetylglucosaminyl deacetylase